MKKLIVTLVLVTALIAGSSTTCFAIPSNNAHTDISPIKSSTYLTATKQGNTRLETKFVRWLTQSWAKADKYVWAASQTVGLSFSAGLGFEATEKVKADLGLTVSKTYTYGVSTFIPAKVNKNSKLALFVRYNVGKVTVTKYNALWIVGQRVNTTKVGSSTGTYYEPTKTSYLKVLYE